MTSQPATADSVDSRTFRNFSEYTAPGCVINPFLLLHHFLCSADTCAQLARRYHTHRATACRCVCLRWAGSACVYVSKLCLEWWEVELCPAQTSLWPTVHVCHFTRFQNSCCHWRFRVGAGRLSSFFLFSLTKPPAVMKNDGAAEHRSRRASLKKSLAIIVPSSATVRMDMKMWWAQLTAQKPFH